MGGNDLLGRDHQAQGVRKEDEAANPAPVHPQQQKSLWMCTSMFPVCGQHHPHCCLRDMWTSHSSKETDKEYKVVLSCCVVYTYILVSEAPPDRVEWRV